MELVIEANRTGITKLGDFWLRQENTAGAHARMEDTVWEGKAMSFIVADAGSHGVYRLEV